MPQPPKNLAQSFVFLTTLFLSCVLVKYLGRQRDTGTVHAFTDKGYPADSDRYVPIHGTVGSQVAYLAHPRRFPGRKVWTPRTKSLAASQNGSLDLRIKNNKQ